MKKLLLTLAAGLFGMGLSAQSYCTPAYSTGCALGDDIDDVNIGTFSHIGTGCSVGHYSDYTATDTVALQKQNPTTVSFTSNYTTQYFAIWIDYNNDGDFDDAGEHLWSSPTGQWSSSTGSISVGSGIATGYYRLRIRSSFSAVIQASESCSSLTYGEAHDYTVEILPPPACPPPVNFFASGITDSSAVLNWSSNDTVFTIEYGPVGFTPGTGIVVNANDTTYNLTNLTSQTQYHIYLQNNCTAAGNGSSSLAGPFFIETFCGAFSTSLFEGFENDSAGGWNNYNVPTCWFFASEPGALGYGYINNTSPAKSGSQSYYLYNSGDSLKEALVSPFITDITDGDKQVEFWAATASWSTGGALLFGTVSDPNDLSTFTLMDSVFVPGGGAYKRYTVYFDAQAGYNMSDHHFAFVTTSAQLWNGISIDDVSFGLAPLCRPPSNFFANGITDSSAVLNWSSNDTTFSIEYGPVGFTPGTGIVISVNDTTYNLTNLTAQTQYHVYLQNNCTAAGNGSSTVEGPFLVETLCGAFSTALFEGFETDSAGGWNNYNEPTCWFLTTDPGAQGYGYIDNLSPVKSGSQCYYLYNSGDALKEALVSPYITDITAGDKQVEFWAATSTWSNGGVLLFGTVSDPNDLSTFTFMDSVIVPGGGTYSKYTMYFDASAGYNMSDHHFAFVTSTAQPWTGVFIDDISFGLAPQCLPPLSFNVSNVGLDSAFLNLTYTGIEGYFEYGPVGFTMGQGTGTVVSTNGSSMWLTGLTANTNYDIYAYQMCADSSLSPAIGPISFNTLSCVSSLLCVYDIELVDSWGDGWNNGEVEILNSAGVVQAVLGTNFTTGQSYIETVGLCSGDTYTIVVSEEGFYPSEMGVNVLKGGSVVASYAPAGGTILGTVMATFTANCNTSCPSLSDPMVAAGKNDATVSFNTNGNTGTFYYEYGLSGFSQGSGAIASSSTTNSSFTLTGLLSETCYDVYMYADCGTNGYSDTLGPIEFCTQICDTASQCHYIFKMYDSFGDGWNGASVNVTLNGLTTSYTIQQGDSNIVDLYICSGTLIEIENAVSGFWDSEISYEFVNVNNPAMNIVQPLGSYAVGYMGSDTANCSPVSCGTPYGVTATSVTGTTATLSWSGSGTAYEVAYTPWGVTVPQVVMATSNTTTLTGLTPSMTYAVEVRQVCGSGDTSLTFYSGFTTDTCSLVGGVVPTFQVNNVTSTNATVTFDWAGATSFTGYMINFGNGQSNSGTGTSDQSTYAANGTYNVVLTLYNDCDTLVQNVSVVVSGIGLEEAGELRSAILFPNPANDVVNVEASGLRAEEVEILVVNYLGREISRATVDVNAGQLQHQLDFSSLASGTYLVILRSDASMKQMPVVVRH